MSQCRGWMLIATLVALWLAWLAPSRAAAETANEVSELQRALQDRDRVIEELSKRLERVEQRLEEIDAPEQADEEQEKAIVDSPPESDLQRAAEALEAVDDPNKDRLIEQAFEQTLIDRGGLLLPWRTFSIEPSFAYVHSSSENIVVDGFTIFPVLVIGDIVSEKLNRDLSLFNLTARIGLPWDSQFEIRVPYGIERFRSHSADGEEVDFTDSGLGDIELRLSHQLYRSAGKWPNLLASVGWKFDTGRNPFNADESEFFVGSGYHSANFRVTGVKVIDPVVYFAGGTYTYNLSTHESIGKFEPGQSFGFDLGMAIALNLNTSLSLTYDQQFTEKSKIEGQRIPGSYNTVGVFSIGSTYSFTDSLTVDFSLGIGVTSDSPDVLFGISLPWRGRF